MADPHTTDETPQDHKLVIYQLLPRLFGNKVALNKPFGTRAENGCGKLNDITERALAEIRALGATHVWYTGVLEHATLSDYQAFGIAPDHPAVVKGRAGSPYAIRDYYDVAPDLAVDVPRRREEFAGLVARTHAAGLAVLLDFVPNHVARAYASDARPPGAAELGAQDDATQAFAPHNNYYYLPGQAFVVPPDYQPLGGHLDLSQWPAYQELPAKATGNDVFAARPSLHDWFETVKLNYGVDYENGRAAHFDPVPATWVQMRDILLYWAAQGVDGFRCDMAELVPVEFWAYVIPALKAAYPRLLFIAEAYDPGQYRRFLEQGQFDYLYDKVGLYDALRRLMTGQGHPAELTRVWQHESRGFGNRMLRFLENHDEQRIASPQFAGDARRARPAMTVAATLGCGPVLLYFGQEVGEPAAGAAGFSEDDGRTTIFDYWGVPEHQKWMNQGRFDGARLSAEQLALRAFYQRLLTLCRSCEALREGRFYELQGAQEADFPAHHLYCYLRYTGQQRLLVVVNFSAEHAYQPQLKLSDAAWAALGLPADGSYSYRDLLNDSPVQSELRLSLPPLAAQVWEIVSEQ